MYRAGETSGGGDSVGSWLLPDSSTAAIAPEPEILDGLSRSGHPTDVNVIEKGSGMSVPVDPRVEASDTATDVSDVSPSLTTPSTVQRFSGRGAPRWAYVSDADLVALGLPVSEWNPPPQPTLTYVVRRQQWVKIGKTAVSVEARLKVLRSPVPGVRCPAGMDLAAPLDLLHTITGDVEEELHERFAAHRVAGEWFIAGPVLAALGVAA